MRCTESICCLLLGVTELGKTRKTNEADKDLDSMHPTLLNSIQGLLHVNPFSALELDLFVCIHMGNQS